MAKKRTKKFAKPWRCPFNNSIKSDYLDTMVNIIASKYSVQYEPYKKQGISIKQLLFNYRNKYPLDKTHGTCIATQKPTEWNEAKVKYNRLVNDPKLIREWYMKKKDEHFKKFGKRTLLTDTTQQKKMLHNRRISGTYMYDNVKVGYVGLYELDFLKRANTLYHIPVTDIEVERVFYYQYKEVRHEYYLDFYIISLNLGIEIKGNSPHRNIEKEKLKEQAVLEAGHDFIFVLDKDYDLLDDYMEEHDIEFDREQ